jgi:hypothetical protein
MVFRRRGHDDRSSGPSETGAAPLTNFALVEAMRAVSVNDSEQSRALLFQLLLDSTVIVATPDASTATGSRTAGVGEHMNIVTLHDEEGSVLPVFTTVDRLLEWRPQGSPYAALAARTVFEMAASNSTAKIVIDPGSPTWGTLTSFEIGSLARGRLPLGTSEVVAEETQVKVGRPATGPADEVVEAVRAAMDAEPRSQRGWMFLLQEGRQRPELMIGVEFADGVDAEAGRAAMRAIVEGAGRRSAGARSLGFMTVTGSWRQTLQSSGEEIFRR